MSEQNLQKVLRRLGKTNGSPPIPSLHSYLTGHGLEALVGSDVARTAIPAASQLNAALLDAASGHIFVFGTPPNEYVCYSNGLLYRNGTFSYESGVTIAHVLRLDPNGTMAYFKVSGDPNNFSNWLLLWTVDSTGSTTYTHLQVNGNIDGVNQLSVLYPILLNGQFFGRGAPNPNGWLNLGPLTFQWGTFPMTTYDVSQSTQFVGFPIAFSAAAFMVVANMQSTEDSVQWVATSNFSSGSARIDILRNSPALGGFNTPLTLAVNWLAVGPT